MSGAATIALAEGCGLAVLAVFVVALLRSHAEIIRRLAALEGSAAPEGDGHLSRTGQRAIAIPREIVGRTPAGDAVKLALDGGSRRTLLAFLSSGCSVCRGLWHDAAGMAAVPSDTRLVLVTKGPDRESPSRLLELAPEGHEVLMSGAAWDGFDIPATPHFVLLDARGEAVLGRGSAPAWSQILTLLQDSDGDLAAVRERSETSARAARAEAALARAGIGPGHPSLYPGRPAGSEAERP